MGVSYDLAVREILLSRIQPKHTLTYFAEHLQFTNHGKFKQPGRLNRIYEQDGPTNVDGRRYKFR